MSLSSSAPKRKREDAASTAASSVDDDKSTATQVETQFLDWLDEGTPARNEDDDDEDSSTEIIDHEEAELRIGTKRVIVSLGDIVYLRPFADTEHNDAAVDSNEKSTNNGSIARIERFYETRNATASSEGEGASVSRKIRARWFLKKKDLAALPDSIQGIPGGSSRDDFINQTLNANDVILSGEADDNDVTTIMGLCSLVFRRPDSDPPATGFVCRYRLEIDESTVQLVPFDGKNQEESDDDEEDDDDDNDDSPPRKVHRKSGGSVDESKLSRSDDASTAGSRGTLSSDDEESDSDERSYQRPRGFPGEGSTEKREIQVGSKFQVEVPPYQPGLPIRSRNPTLVWKPGKISDDLLDEYFEKVAGILNPYLKEHDLTHDDMYSSLPSNEVERTLLQKKNPEENIPTLSSISTSSSLSPTKNNLLRECDADALLFVLSQKEYYIPAALAEIKKDPVKYITHWTRQQKELFNSGFRRYSGSLRMIGRGVAPHKDHKEVADYHYRFKIPDQFRRFQTKKREQAIRMMECIETRRYLNTPITTAEERAAAGEKPKPKASEWNKTATGDVIGAVENRRVDAKTLLLEVEQQLGKEKLAEVADAIKRLHQTSVVELRLVLLEILRGHPDLLQKFIAFLPARFRV